MICPECNGGGRVRKRFLLFFTRRARCPKCLGFGVFPPPVDEIVRSRAPYRDDDDDRWPASSYGSTTASAQPSADQPFEIGSGGRSGGGGASGSWDASDTTGATDAPLIADPFSSAGSAIVSGSADAADAVDASSQDSSSSTGDSPSDTSGGDGGTSY